MVGVCSPPAVERFQFRHADEHEIQAMGNGSSAACACMRMRGLLAVVNGLDSSKSVQDPAELLHGELYSSDSRKECSQWQYGH